MAEAETGSESVDEFFLRTSKDLSEQVGIDAELAVILSDHLISGSDASGVQQAKDKVLALAKARAEATLASPGAAHG